MAKELHIGFQVVRIQLLPRRLVCQETGVPGDDMVIPDMPADMIAGILASWVCYQLLWMSCVFIFH
jgi:hypothetical protein